MYLFGDLHGSCCYFEDRMRHVPPGENVVCLGDIGLSYGGRFNYGLRDRMDEYKDNTFYIMRGNHDDRYSKVIPKRRLCYDADGVFHDEKRPNIKYLPDDGGMVCIDNKMCLVIPGAYSVDKWYRLSMLLPWNKDEQLTEHEMERIERIAEYAEKIDLVFSHTCPRLWQDEFKDELFLGGIDQSTVDNTMEDWLQSTILPIVQKKNPDYKWYFGHYHADCVVDNEHGIMLMNKVIGV